jgi:hypothetical protein
MSKKNNSTINNTTIRNDEIRKLDWERAISRYEHEDEAIENLKKVITDEQFEELLKLGINFDHDREKETRIIVQATEKFHNWGFDVKYPGFNFLSKFTIMIQYFGTEIVVHPMSITIPVDMLDDAVKEAEENLGSELLKNIVELSKKSEFSMNPDLNKPIPFEEASARIQRLVNALEKRGWNPRMYPWEYDDWKSSFPKGHIDCLIRAILEGASGKIQCIGCKSVTYLDGGFMKCDRIKMITETYENGVPRRLSYGETSVSANGYVQSNIVTKYSDPCSLCYTRATRDELMKKHEKKGES